MNTILSKLQQHGLTALTLQKLVTYSIAIFVAYATFTVIYELFISPQKDVPGPFWAKFTRLWLLSTVHKGDSHKVIVDLHKKHGSVVRLAPNTYSFSSPEDQKKIYDLKTEFRKTTFYNTAGHPARKNIFNIFPKPEHAERKKKLSNMYSMSSMVNYEGAVDRMNSLLCSKFRGFASKGQKIHVPDFMQCYAFDVIGEITLDKNFGLMENEGDVDDMISLVQGSNAYMGQVGIVPEVHKWFVWFGETVKAKTGGTKIEYLAGTTIQKYRNAPLDAKEDPRADPFITKLVRLEAAGKVDYDAILDSIGGNIAAGSDTTAITLSTALYYLYRSPHSLKALREEIDRLAADGTISDPVTFKEAQAMPYLQAVIAEALRIHPAVGYILERTTPEGGTELAGRYFPGGVRVGVSAWALHQDPELYGKDVDVFRPERFLETNSKTSSLQHGQMFTFGAGARSCLGKNVSLLEMTKVIPQIVRQFDLIFDSDKPWETYTSWFVWQKYYCYLEPRKDLVEHSSMAKA